MVVGADGKVEARVIKIGQAIGNKWVVTDGLKAGEQVIVEGLQKVQPGMMVKPVPFDSSRRQQFHTAGAGPGKLKGHRHAEIFH